MPIFTGRLANGKPVINVVLSISVPYEENFQKIHPGKKIPEPIQGLALIDTGSSLTLIDHKHTSTLGLRQNGWENVLFLGKLRPTRSPIWDAGIRFLMNEGESPLFFTAWPCAGRAELGYDAVIGRDLLRHLNFHFDGANDEFSLDYNGPDKIEE